MLWYLVEALVGDWWPNGEPAQLRMAAAAWNATAAPLYGVTGQNAGPYGVIDAQQMPDKEPMKAAVRDVGTAMSSLAGEAQRLSTQLTNFATDVETTQHAICDLLNKLTSVVGSVIDQGVMGTVFELLTGDAEEKIQEVANDIKAVIANHKRQSAARKELLAQLVTSIKNYTRAIEIITRVELVNYLGEDAGRIVANVNDALTDTSVGLTLGGINTVGGLVTSFDPIGDPKGTWATIEGLGKMAEIFNPLTAPLAFATDPQGSLDMVKGLIHFDDLTGDRPFIGIGELGFDIGTAVLPGGAGAKAAGGARAAEGAAARTEISATERVAGEAGEIASATGGLRNIAHDVEGATAKLDDLNKTTLDSPKPPSGSPDPLPKAPEPGPPVPREPAPPPTGGKPTSAPPSGDRLPPPVTHTPHTEPAPTGEGAPGRVLDAAEVSSAPASSAGRPPTSDPIGDAPAAPAAGASGSGSGLPSVPSAGSMGGEAAHAPGEMPSGMGDAGDRVPVSVGAHGAADGADGAGHSLHPGGGDGGTVGSHGGSGDHGSGSHETGGGHGEPAEHGSHDGDNVPSGHDVGSGPHTHRPPEEILHDLKPWDRDRIERAVIPDGVEQDLLRNGAPSDFAATAAENPYSGMSRNEIIEKYWDDQNGTWRWPDHSGFKDGVYAVADRIPEGKLVDRVGLVEDWTGDFMSTAGDAYPTRSLAPGTSGEYHLFEGTGVQLPPEWELRFGEAGPAFGQPGGSTQWVVVDEFDNHVLIDQLLKGGYIRRIPRSGG